MDGTTHARVQSPLLARTEVLRHPTDPTAYRWVRFIVFRAGSAFMVSSFGHQIASVGDVVLLSAEVPCSSEPEGPIVTTTTYLSVEYALDQLFWQ